VRLRPAQSRTGSLLEAASNVVAGYLLALVTQRLLYPAFGISTTLAADALIAGAFTAVSFARSYVLRRGFEWLQRRLGDARA
jgi:hypothetical protein